MSVCRRMKPRLTASSAASTCRLRRAANGCRPSNSGRDGLSWARSASLSASSGALLLNCAYASFALMSQKVTGSAWLDGTGSWPSPGKASSSSKTGRRVTSTSATAMAAISRSSRWRSRSIATPRSRVPRCFSNAGWIVSFCRSFGSNTACGTGTSHFTVSGWLRSKGARPAEPSSSRSSCSRGTGACAWR